MKKILILSLATAAFCLMTADAEACYKHGNSKWALHYAGEHNAKLNTCDFTMVDCIVEMNVTAPCGPGRFDIYIMALDTNGIAGSRYGLGCDPPTGCFYFYGWTKCSDFEIPTPGWPGCGQGNAQTWSVEQPPGHVTMGILDVYVYPGCGCCLQMTDDPRTGYGEWCDGASPAPNCCQVPQATFPAAFGAVCFGVPGYNPCGIIPVEQRSWGAVKAIYN